MEDTALRFCMKAEIVSLFSAETHEERSLQLIKQGAEKETNTWDHNDVGSREKYKTNWINAKKNYWI